MLPFITPVLLHQAPVAYYTLLFCHRYSKLHATVLIKFIFVRIWHQRSAVIIIYVRQWKELKESFVTSGKQNKNINVWFQVNQTGIKSIPLQV